MYVMRRGLGVLKPADIGLSDADIDTQLFSFRDIVSMGAGKSAGETFTDFMNQNSGKILAGAAIFAGILIFTGSRR